MDKIPKMRLKEARLHTLEAMKQCFEDVLAGKLNHKGDTESYSFNGYLYDKISRKSISLAPLKIEAIGFDKFDDKHDMVQLKVLVTYLPNTVNIDVPALKDVMKFSGLKDACLIDKWRHTPDEGHYVLNANVCAHNNYNGKLPFLKNKYDSMAPLQGPINIVQDTQKLTINKADIEKVLLAIDKKKLRDEKERFSNSSIFR